MSGPVNGLVPTDELVTPFVVEDTMFVFQVE
jgi:hypothetical protein